MLHDVESPEQARRYQEALEAAVIEQRPGLAEDRAGLEKVIEQGFSDLTGGRYDTDEAVLVGQAARKALEAAADGAGDGTPPHAGQAAGESEPEPHVDEAAGGPGPEPFDDHTDELPPGDWEELAYLEGYRAGSLDGARSGLVAGVLVGLGLAYLGYRLLQARAVGLAPGADPAVAARPAPPLQTAPVGSEG